MSKLLHFQVSGEQCFVIAEPWIKGPTAELQSYRNELFETNIREEKLRRKAGKSICVWKHFGLDPTHVLRLSDPGSCLLFRLGMISLKEQQGSRELAPRGAERRPARLDVSTGHIPRALSSNRCSLTTQHSSPQPQPPDPVGAGAAGEQQHLQREGHRAPFLNHTELCQGVAGSASQGDISVVLKHMLLKEREKK